MADSMFMPPAAVLTTMPDTADHAALMDDVYRHQRFIYNLTRKYYLSAATG